MRAVHSLENQALENPVPRIQETRQQEDEGGVHSVTLVSLARGSVLDAKPSLKLLANGIWDCDFSGVAFGLRSRRGIIAKIGDADESYELICAGATRKYARLAGDFSAVVDVAG